MSDFGLHTLKPAPGSRKPRKRVGRGEGSGMGKTAGRGEKGYGSRSGAKDRARFEGGQMPIHMRMRKLRGPNKKKSMPFEPFRTHTQPVNLADLEARFDKGADVTLEALRDKGLGTRKGIPVKILAKGEVTKPLTVHAHAFSALRQARPSRLPAGRATWSSNLPRPMLSTILSAFRVADIRKKLAFTALLLGALPARVAHPGAGRRRRRPSTPSRSSSAAAASSIC